jgi:hypothetical protein
MYLRNVYILYKQSRSPRRMLYEQEARAGRNPKSKMVI